MKERSGDILRRSIRQIQRTRPTMIGGREPQVGEFQGLIKDVKDLMTDTTDYLGDGGKIEDIATNYS